MNGNKLLPDDYIPPFNQQDMEQIIETGKAYMSTHIPAHASFGTLMHSQLHFISSALWLMQFAILLFVIAASWFLKDLDYMNTSRLMIVLAPVSVCLALPELTKNSSCGVLEMELACKYSAATVFLTRMFLVGTINVFGIMIYSAFFSFQWQLRFLNVALYGLIPVNCVYVLSIFAFQIMKIHSRVAALACSLASGVLCCITLNHMVVLYQLSTGIQVIIYLSSCLILAIQCLHQVRNLTNRKDLYLWNYT